jgi:hypothetical protein
MDKSKNQKQTEPVAELFRLSRQLLNSPTEENCQTILGWILEGAKSVASCYKQASRKDKSFHANRAKKFGEEWQKLLPQLQLNADPTILRFHQLQIEKELESVMELSAAI